MWVFIVVYPVLIFVIVSFFSNNCRLYVFSPEMVLMCISYFVNSRFVWSRNCRLATPTMSFSNLAGVQLGVLSKEKVWNK